MAMGCAVCININIGALGIFSFPLYTMSLQGLYCTVNTLCTFLTLQRPEKQKQKLKKKQLTNY